MIYDGDCAFCSRTVDEITSRFAVLPEFVAWQDADLDRLSLTLDDALGASWLIIEDQGRLERFRGAAGFTRLLRMQPQFGVRYLGHLAELPLVRDAAAVGYQWVADHRHQLPGGTAACQLPAPAGAPA